MIQRCPVCHRPMTGDRLRTIPQNSRYFAILTAAESYTGYSKDELHDMFRAKYLRVPAMDHRLPDRIRSTTELSTKEFAEYSERVEMDIAELIANPQEVTG